MNKREAKMIALRAIADLGDTSLHEFLNEEYEDEDMGKIEAQILVVTDELRARAQTLESGTRRRK